MQNNISVARIAYKKNTEKIKIINTYKFLGIHKMDLYFFISNMLGWGEYICIQL